MNEQLLQTFKALSDASRLRIVGLLAARPMAVEELAAALELSPGTVVHHLARLRDAELVASRPCPPYVEYSLDLRRLSEIGRQVNDLSRESVEQGALLDGPDGKPRAAFDAKVLRSFFDGGRLTSIPAQEKKRLVVLRYLAETLFEPGRRYPEKELNATLAQVHPDVASLRRYMVDLRFMSRERGEYWLESPEAWPR